MSDKRGRQLDARHVAHAHERAVRIGAHDDGAEFLDAGQTPLGLDGELELLVRQRGWAPMRPIAACMFCACSALAMSAGVSPKLVRRSVSSQTRML